MSLPVESRLASTGIDKALETAPENVVPVRLAWEFDWLKGLAGPASWLDAVGVRSLPVDANGFEFALVGWLKGLTGCWKAGLSKAGGFDAELLMEGCCHNGFVG